MTHPIIGEAFVRVRPEFTGFQAQAQQQIQANLAGVARQTERVGTGARNATREVERFDRGIIAANASALGFGRALTFASSTFIAGAGLGAVLRAGVDEFGNMTRVAATTNAILRATGGAAGISAEGVNRLAKQQEHLTGADDELVKQAENVLLSFRRIRNEAGRGNDIFTRATRASSDLATVFGQDVPSAARQLGRALADPARGVVLLRRAGVVFTQDQIKLIKALVDTGQTLKAQRLVLDQVESSVGGTARAIGQTLPGQLDILRERAKDALGEYTRRLSESRQAAELAASGARGLGQTFDVIKGTVQAIGPPLITVAQAAIKVADAVGDVGPILAAAAAYKGVGLAVGIAASAQTAYARAVLIAAGANTREAAAVATTTAALRAQSIAAVTSGGVAATAISRGGVLLPASVGLSAERTAVSVARVGFAGRAAALGLGASRVALAAVGGPLGAAAIGAAALTIGFLRLKRQAENATGTINATRTALTLLQQSTQHGINLRTRVGAARDAVQQAQDAILAAQAGLTGAESRQARSQAAPGSLEQRALADQVRTARIRLRDATAALNQAETTLSATQRESADRQRGLPNVIADQTRKLRAQIDAVTGLTENIVRGPLGEGLTFTKPEQSDTTKLENFVKLMDKLRQSGTAAQRTVGEVLGRIAGRLGGLPTEKQIRVVIALAVRGDSPEKILNQLGQGADLIRRQFSDIADARRRAADGTGAENSALQQEFAAAQAVLRSEREKLATLKETVSKRRDELQAARDSVTAARESLTAAREARAAAIEGLQNARQALVDSQTALADAVKSARDSVNQAIRDAKSNLDTLGQSIADAFGKFRDAAGTSLGTGALGKQFRALRDEILAGGGGPETQRAAQRISSQLERTQGPDASKLPQQFADLTDQLDRGKITLPQFNRELNKLLRGLNLAAFQRQFGSAAANQLREQIAALRTQARLIASGPQRAGGGFQATLVGPLQAVAAGSRQILDAERGVRAATRDVAKAQQDIVRTTREIGQAQHRLQEAQAKEERKQTVELRAIRKAVEQSAKVKAAEARKNKPKPDGKAGDAANKATTAGAGAP